jgi:uncharacterized protein (TIGR03382 family)
VLRPLAVCFALGALALVARSAGADEGEPLSAKMPWIVDPGDDLDLSPLERRYGIDPRSLDVEPFWQDGMLFDRDSATEAMLEQAGVGPLHAVQYEPAPGILYIEMGGVTLEPTCGNGDSANAALNCSPLVEQQTQFPSYGGGSEQAAMFETLANYYEPFNIVMSTARPPEWVPYTMAVIGGSAGLAGLGGGVCGVANVACDGLKRNHVSLSFPQSCSGVAEIAAQETSHNWGLEHTDNQTDLMYPFANGGFKTFVDQCMTISHATGDGITQCGFIHEAYCPSGAGEQQNSYAELMAVFGPRVVDDEPPQILTLEPPDGTAFTTEDSFLISGTVAENTNFIAMKFTLESGGETLRTRCTNNVCDEDYDLTAGFDPNGVPFEFTRLTEAPEGTYEVTYEVMDAYGGYDSRTATYYVTEDGQPPMTTTNPTDSDGSGTDGDGTATGTTDGEGDGASVGSDDDDDDDDETDTDLGLDDGGGPKGCGCGTGGGATGLVLLLFAGLGRRRRARRTSQGATGATARR